MIRKQVTLSISQDIYSYLDNAADKYGMSVNSVINLILFDHFQNTDQEQIQFLSR